MKINIIENCLVEELPEPIKSAAIANIKKDWNYDSEVDTVMSIDWSDCNESHLNGSDFWQKVYEGRIKEIPEDILKFWRYDEFKAEESLIENIEPGVYKAKYGNKKYEITIKEIK